jgi:hypothetical protein
MLQAVTKMTVPDGGIYTYAYDANNNLVSLLIPTAAPARTFTATPHKADENSVATQSLIAKLSASCSPSHP